MQVGGGIASVLGRTLGLKPEKVKALIPVGAAAAVAAAFNTPLAAVLFALEEVVSDLHAPILGSVVLASATSWGVLRMLLGNDPLFKVPAYELVNPWEFVIYGILGNFRRDCFGGIHATVAAGSSLVSATTEKDGVVSTGGRRSAGRSDGLVCAGGDGSRLQICGRRVERKSGAESDGAAAGVEVVATAVSYASGNAAGFLGRACFSARCWEERSKRGAPLFPRIRATPGAYALVGMGTAFAGIVRAPMTSVVMIF